MLLYRTKENDRDCCKYVDIRNGKLHRDINNDVIVEGACFSTRIYDDYDNIETLLSREEFERLKNAHETPDDDFADIIAKLESSDNDGFYEYIQESEIEAIMDEYGVSYNDAHRILSEYPYSHAYNDRGIIGCIYRNVNEMGKEVVNMTHNIEDWLEDYIDYDLIGYNEIEANNAILLDNGQVVEYNF